MHGRKAPGNSPTLGCRSKPTPTTIACSVHVRSVTSKMTPFCESPREEHSGEQKSHMLESSWLPEDVFGGVPEPLFYDLEAVGSVGSPCDASSKGTSSQDLDAPYSSGDEAGCLAALFHKIDFKQIEIKMDFNKVHDALEKAVVNFSDFRRCLPHPAGAPDSGWLIGRGGGMRPPPGCKISFSGPRSGSIHWVRAHHGVLVVEGCITPCKSERVTGAGRTKMRRIFMLRDRRPSQGNWTSYMPRVRSGRARRSLFYSKDVAFYIFKDKFFGREEVDRLLKCLRICTNICDDKSS